MTSIQDLKAKLEEHLKDYPYHKGRPGKRGGSLPKGAIAPSAVSTSGGKVTIKISRKQAKSILDATFPEYKGNKVVVKFSPSVSFYDTNWGGGTRNKYIAVASDGRTAALDVPAPWLNVVEGTTSPIPENMLVVEHSIFMGKDVGITIWAHPANLPKWLPEGR